MTKPSLPPMLLVALESSWHDAYIVIIGLMRARGIVLPLKVALSASAAGTKPVSGEGAIDWPMRRALAAGVHEALSDGPDIDLSNAWWLLSLDPHDEENRNRAHCALLHLSVLIGPRADVDPTVRGWGLLAAGLNRIDDHDPFACAHRLARDGSPLPVTVPVRAVSELTVQMEALAYFAAAQRTLPDAKNLVFAAITEVIEAQESDVHGLLSELEAIRSLKPDSESARRTEEFAGRFDVFAHSAGLFAESQLSEINGALSILSVRSSDIAGMRYAAAKIAASAEQAVKLGLAPRREAQAIACAWGMISHYQNAIDEPPQRPDETDFFALAHRNFVALLKNFFAAYTDDSEPEPETEPPDEPAAIGDRIVVLPRVGGLINTNSGREATAAFASIAGIPLNRVRTPDIEKVRVALRKEFPHFVLQIETLLADLANTEFVKFRSTLLLGTFGVGKSRFVRKLCHAVGIPLHRYDGANASDNVFGGTPRRWASGQPSVPLEAVRESGIANPAVIIDELDKAGISTLHGSLANALLPFLEEETAARYPDGYALADCNLAHVSFLATANDIGAIPLALRDRFRLLQLPEPRPEHLPALARSLVRDIAAESGGDARWFPDLDVEELVAVGTLWRGGSLRRLRAIVERMLSYREKRAVH
jgi:ATP-dependent Lon protease